jgi:hypothetical protein
MKGPIFCALCAATFGCVGITIFNESPARGSTLDLQQQNPDLYAGFLTADYTPSSGSTGSFTATGWPISFNVSGTSEPDYPTINGGTYSLSASITKTGLPLSGSLNVTGTIPGLATSGTLLKGTLAQFGFAPGGGDIFEFIYNITGGDLAPFYHGKTGVILTATGSGFTGSFTTNFATNASQAASDNFIMPVPEPSSALLFMALIGIGMLSARFRWWHGGRLVT